MATNNRNGKPRKKPRPESDTHMSLEDRRNILSLVAIGDYDNLDLNIDGRSTLSYVLEALAIETICTSLTTEQEITPALLVQAKVLHDLRS